MATKIKKKATFNKKKAGHDDLTPPPSLFTFTISTRATTRAKHRRAKQRNVATIPRYPVYSNKWYSVVLIASTGVRPLEAETYPVRSNTNAV